PGCPADLGPTDKCNDDVLTVVFDNHSSIRYAFAHHEEEKSLEMYAAMFGMELSDFDAVIANHGNDPFMTQDKVLESADRLKGKNTAMFWLSTYVDGFWQQQENQALPPHHAG
ncbi:unnamed protein product, partial [Discosporangium mesarthrocarpum]